MEKCYAEFRKPNKQRAPRCPQGEITTTVKKSGDYKKLDVYVINPSMNIEKMNPSTSKNKRKKPSAVDLQGVHFPDDLEESFHQGLINQSIAIKEEASTHMECNNNDHNNHISNNNNTNNNNTSNNNNNNNQNNNNQSLMSDQLVPNPIDYLENYHQLDDVTMMDSECGKMDVVTSVVELEPNLPLEDSKPKWVMTKRSETQNNNNNSYNSISYKGSKRTSFSQVEKKRQRVVKSQSNVRLSQVGWKKPYIDVCNAGPSHQNMSIDDVGEHQNMSIDYDSERLVPLWKNPNHSVFLDKSKTNKNNSYNNNNNNINSNNNNKNITSNNNNSTINHNNRSINNGNKNHNTNKGSTKINNNTKFIHSNFKSLPGGSNFSIAQTETPLLKKGMQIVPETPLLRPSGFSVPETPLLGVGGFSEPETPLFGVGGLSVPETPLLGVGQFSVPETPLIGVGGCIAPKLGKTVVEETPLIAMGRTVVEETPLLQIPPKTPSLGAGGRVVPEPSYLL